MKIVFISGIPRSGTTLVQSEFSKLLGAESDPETWILPYHYGQKYYQILSIYGGIATKIFFNKFLDDYKLEGRHTNSIDNAVINTFKHRMLQSQSKTYLEKTPRNLFFLDDIERLKNRSDLEVQSIILLRHPLDIISSIDDTWGKYYYSFWMLKYDILNGLKVIIDASDCHVKIKYEDYVNGLVDCNSIFNIENDSQPKVDVNLRINENDAGDPNFGKKYKSISTASVYKFHRQNLPVLKAFIYNRFLQRDEVKSFIKLYYPKSSNYRYRYNILNGLGFRYLIASSISWLAQYIPLKSIKIQLQQKSMFR